MYILREMCCAVVMLRVSTYHACGLRAACCVLRAVCSRLRCAALSYVTFIIGDYMYWLVAVVVR